MTIIYGINEMIDINPYLKILILKIKIIIKLLKIKLIEENIQKIYIFIKIFFWLRSL